MKIVISSNIHYVIPLNILLQSLKKHNNIFPIIIVKSNSIDEKICYENNLLYINTIENNYEYTSFNMIKKYMNDSRIYDTSYLFLHDTCIVGPKFIQSLNYYEKILSINDLFMSPIRNSNIILLHSSIFNNFDYFYENLSKKEACDLEGNINVRNFSNISNYGKINLLKPRFYVGFFDVYNTKYPRKIFHYPDFDIYKTVLHNKFGDFDPINKVKQIYKNSSFVKRHKREKLHFKNQEVKLHFHIT